MPSPPRLFVDRLLSGDNAVFALPDGAARHAQVLRLQAGAALALFDGSGGEWSAEVVAMERRGVQVRLLSHDAREAELPIAVTLALAMPANDRMDALVEKATELGVAAIVPLVTERTVLRLSGERAARRQAHWQGIAVAACEQCGRNRVSTIAAVRTLSDWLNALPAPEPSEGCRLMLGWHDALPWQEASARIVAAATLLSGPEGGLSEAEEDAARRCGFVPTSLGPRTLRADTAPLAALASLALRSLDEAGPGRA